MMDEHELHRTLETICDGLAALVPRHGPDRKELINRARWHQTMMHRTDRNEVKKPRNSGGEALQEIADSGQGDLYSMKIAKAALAKCQQEATMSDAEDLIQAIIELEPFDPDHELAVCVNYESLRGLVKDRFSEIESQLSAEREANARLREAENAKLKEALAGFVWDMIDQRYDNGCEIFGSLIKHGILVRHVATEPCLPDGCNCSSYFGPDEFPVECYRPAEWLPTPPAGGDDE